MGLTETNFPPDAKRNQCDYGVYLDYHGFTGGKWDCQFTLPDQTQYDYETFADMGVGWITGSWSGGSLCNIR